MEGLVVYGLALVAVDKPIDSAFEYFDIRDRLQSIERKPFDFLSLKATFSKTYAFRTPQNVIGIIEIAARNDDHHGLLVRYKLLHAPPLTVVTWQQHELARLASVTQTERNVLESLLPKQEDAISVVRSATDMLQKQSDTVAKESDSDIICQRLKILECQHQIDAFSSRLPEDDPFIKDRERGVGVLERELKILERTRNSPTDRLAELSKLADAEVKRHMDELVKRYDDSHPVVDPSLKELSISEKLFRMRKSEQNEQLTHLLRVKESLERLLSWEQSEGLGGSFDSQELKEELNSLLATIDFVRNGPRRPERSPWEATQTEEKKRDATVSPLAASPENAESFRRAMTEGMLPNLRAYDAKVLSTIKPATQPARANPATQPSPKDFHL